MDLQRNLIFDLNRGIAFMGLAWAMCVGVDPQRNGSSYLSKRMAPNDLISALFTRNGVIMVSIHKNNKLSN